MARMACAASAALTPEAISMLSQLQTMLLQWLPNTTDSEHKQMGHDKVSYVSVKVLVVYEVVSVTFSVDVPIQ